MFDTDLYTTLSTNAPLVALIGTRIHRRRLPQNPTLPAIVVNLIGSQSVHSMDGFSGLAFKQFQISCWGSSDSSCRAVAEAVKTALAGQGIGSPAAGFCTVDDERDMEDDDPLVFRRDLDFSVNFNS